LFPTLPPPDPLLLLAHRPLLHPSLRRVCGRSSSRRGRVRPRGIHGHPLLMAPIKVTPVCRGEPKGKVKSTYRRNVGEHDE
jgi:hypothetical protein